jgi:hypothetical protein
MNIIPKGIYLHIYKTNLQIVFKTVIAFNRGFDKNKKGRKILPQY